MAPARRPGKRSPKVAVPGDVLSRDAWDVARVQYKDVGPADPWQDEATQAQDQNRRPRVALEPCTCYCLCGGQGVGPLCYLCRTEVHHRCSKACRIFPTRRACDGGVRSGERGGRQ